MPSGEQAPPRVHRCWGEPNVPRARRRQVAGCTRGWRLHTYATAGEERDGGNKRFEGEGWIGEDKP
jgi:hypothetical protein